MLINTKQNVRLVYSNIRILTCFLLSSISVVVYAQQPFDAQAHRGGRGLMPENTIPAMLDAIDRGITTLEMDLQLSKDRQVIVSHDAAFNSNFATTPQGDTLTKEAARKIVLYQLNYDSIRKYDVGMKFNPEFPRQQKIPVSKPLLSDLLDKTEAYAKQKQRPVYYNIEIKSGPAADGKYYPDLETFIDLAMTVINKKGMTSRVMIQAFDTRALEILHRKYPQYALSYLIGEKEKRPLDELLKNLGFTPPILSPQSSMVTADLVKQCHQQKMKIIPWTVNNLPELQRLKDWGVDGVISDYSDLFSQLK